MKAGRASEPAMEWCSEQVPLEGLEVGVAGLCAASHEDRPRWFFVTQDGRVRGLDLDDGAQFFSAQLPFAFSPPRDQVAGGAPAREATLTASRDGRYLAVVETYGQRGAVYDVERSVLLKELARGDYHPDVSGWAVALRDDVLIAATEWNRLEAWRLPSGERLAPDAAETTYDYFWGLASLSPSQRFLVSFGWHWQPVGAVRVIDLDAWLRTREDPPPMPFEPMLADWWDADVCWLDEQRVAMLGTTPEEDDWFLGKQDGLMIYDLASRRLERFFLGLVAGQLAFDGQRLVLLGAKETRVVSPESGEVLATLAVGTQAWHPGTRTALSLPPAGGRAVGLHWLVGTHGRREALPESPGAADLLVLADALDETGADPAAIAHCRAPGPHGRRCWVLEAHKAPPLR